MIVEGIEQRSYDWFRSRLGKITGSLVHLLMTAGRKKDEQFSETAKGYIKTLAFERTLNPALIDDDDTFQEYLDEVNVTTKAMRIGTEREDEAVDKWKAYVGDRYEVVEVSSCRHDEIAYFAASPDRIIYDRETREMGVLEVKCPNGGTHMGYRHDIHDWQSLKNAKKEYYWQMQAEMACTGARFGIFLSYEPWSLKAIHTAYIERNDSDIMIMEERVREANRLIEEYTL